MSSGSSSGRLQIAAAAMGGAAAAAMALHYLTGRRETSSTAANDYGSIDMMNAAAVEEAPAAAPAAGDVASVTFPLPRSVYRQLEEDGYYVLKGMLPDDVVASARSVCERIVDGIARKLVAEGKAASAMEDEPFETRLARLFESHPEDAPRIFREELHTADMAKVFFCPALLDLVESALDSPEIRLDSDFAAYPKYSIRDEDALASARTMWHAARMHYDPGHVSESQIDESMRGMINVWTPLVRTGRQNGCVRVIPGSHKLDVLSMLPKQGGGYHASREKGYLEVDAELVRKHEAKAVDVELEPGDVLLFRQNMIHAGHPNTTDRIRWSMDWRYQNALLPTTSSDLGQNNKAFLVRSAQNPDHVGWVDGLKPLPSRSQTL